MSEPTTPKESVDHVEEARKRVRWSEETSVDRPVDYGRYLNEAQTHAQIAIATQLQGIREALEGVISTNELPSGRTDRKLRVTSV